MPSHHPGSLRFSQLRREPDGMLSRDEVVAPFIDTFVVVYWLSVIVLFMLLVWLLIKCMGHANGAAETAAEDKAEESYIGGSRSSIDDLEVEEQVEVSRELPQNVWAMNVLASVGQGTIRHQWGDTEVSYDISPGMMAAISITMAGLQVFSLHCLLQAMDPTSRPVTSQPSDKWVKTTWTVNFMKWYMVSILSILSVGEAGQFRTVATAALELNAKRLRAPRILTLLIISCQYVIMLFMLFVGTSAVLSFNAVPDIIYSSMAITFITQTDEMMLEMVHQVFDLEAVFLIMHTHPNAKPKGARRMSASAEAESPHVTLARTDQTSFDEEGLPAGNINTADATAGDEMRESLMSARHLRHSGQRGSRRSRSTHTAAGMRFSISPQDSALKCRMGKRDTLTKLISTHSSFAEGLGDDDFKPRQIPQWMDVCNHFLVAFPVFWGVCLVWRAFLTNVSPNSRMYYLTEHIFRSR